MKKLLFALFASFILFGCEDSIVPPDDPELFTDITYQVNGNGIAAAGSITYGDLKYSNSNYPDSLIWEYVSVEDKTLPWAIVTNTCVGHPVKLSALASGNPGSSLQLRIFDGATLVAEKVYESNGFIWGGTLEYIIPNP